MAPWGNSLTILQTFFLSFPFSASAGMVLSFFLLVIRPGFFITKARPDYFFFQKFPHKNQIVAPKEDTEIFGMNMPFISSSEAINAHFMNGDP